VAIPALLYWAYRLISEVFWNRLAEPVVRLSSEIIRPGKEILVECELTARTEATIREVAVGFQSKESVGEDLRYESYGEWILPFQREPIGRTPIAVRQRLTTPTNVNSRWNGSDVKWYVTLQVKVDGGITIRRRYCFEMWA
jgi:hypothetical protein